MKIMGRLPSTCGLEAQGVRHARRAASVPCVGALSESELPCAWGVLAVRRRLVRLRHGVLSAHGATSSRNDAGVGRPARRGTVPSTQWAVRAPTEGEEAASWTRSSSKGSEGPACSEGPASALGAIRAARRREVGSKLVVSNAQLMTSPQGRA